MDLAAGHTDVECGDSSSTASSASRQATPRVSSWAPTGNQPNPVGGMARRRPWDGRGAAECATGRRRNAVGPCSRESKRSAGKQFPACWTPLVRAATATACSSVNRAASRCVRSNGVWCRNRKAAPGADRLQYVTAAGVRRSPTDYDSTLDDTVARRIDKICWHVRALFLLARASSCLIPHGTFVDQGLVARARDSGHGELP